MGSTNRDLDVTYDGYPDNRGPNLSSNREGNHIQQTDAQSTAQNSNDSDEPPPPDYPCRDECMQCGKKITEVDNTDIINEQATESLPRCSCECHRQPQEFAVQLPAGHIPPTGASCLPGCGYSGLPCYNCSSIQAHLQPQNQTTGSTESSTTSSNQVPTFSPQIYTIELMGQSTADREDINHVTHHQQIIIESDERNGRKMGISLVFFTFFIIVFITVFKMLLKGSGGSFW